MTIRLSLAMIVRNEEERIRSLLADAGQVCSEMVVVDTGSTDRTMDAAAEAGARVHQITWRNDFASARNASLAWCSGDWILWLDADDVLPRSTVHALRGLEDWIQPDTEAVAAPYHCEFDANGTAVTYLSCIRLMRRGSSLRWSGRVSEQVEAEGRTVLLMPDLVVEHRPDEARQARGRERNLAMLEAEIAGGRADGRTRFHLGNELMAAGKHKEAIDAYEVFLETVQKPATDRYWAWVRIADAARVVADEDLLRMACLEAIDEDPGRAEAYVSYGRYFYDKLQWAKAAPLFVAATAARPPSAGLLRAPDYRFAPWDYLSVCLDHAGRRGEAITAAQRAFAGNPEGERVRQNMRWMVDNL